MNDQAKILSCWTSSFENSVIYPMNRTNGYCKWISFLFLLAWLEISVSALQCTCPADMKTLREEAGGRSAKQLALDSYNSGVRCSWAGLTCCAASHYLAAIELHPTFAEAYQNVANIIERGCEENNFGGLRIERNPMLAMDFHRTSIECAPDAEFRVGAMSNLFTLETQSSGGKEKEKLQRMVTELESALQQLPRPWHENSHFTLAMLYINLEQRAQAQELLMDLLENNPRHAMALLNAGNYHFLREEFGPAGAYYEAAVEAMAEMKGEEDYLNRVMAMCNVGQCYREQGMLAEAERTFFAALAEMHVHIPRQVTTEVEDGAPTPAKTLHVYHKGTEVFTAMNLAAIKSLGCSWSQYEELEGFLLQSVISQLQDPKAYETVGTGDAGLIDPYTFSLQRYASRISDAGNSHLACAAVLAGMNPHYEFPVRSDWFATATSDLVSTASTRPLRVGYLSQDWRNHPMGRLTMNLVTSHQPTNVTAVCISYGARDGSSVRTFVENRAAMFYDVLDVPSNQDVASFIETLQLDVLVDLTTHTYRGRIGIAALKPAPVVINYLGYPGTTGCRAFDFSMVDALSAPAELAPSAFTEKLLYLPFIYQSNFMDSHVMPCLFSDRRACRRRAVLTRVRHKNDVFHSKGLDDEENMAEAKINPHVRLAGDSGIWANPARTWLCSFNTNKKLEPVVFQTWMQILQENPRALLVLLEMSNTPKKAILKNAAMYGIHSSRIVFIMNLPWKQHLYRLSACDLVLDTFTYGAHTTASDALWMWVPVLSLEGWGSQRMPSRVAAAITRSLLGDAAVVPVVQSVKQYQSIGIKLSNSVRVAHKLHDQIALASLRQPTFANAAQTAHVERAYQVATEIRMFGKRGKDSYPLALHGIVGKPESEAQQNSFASILKDQLVAELNDCLNNRASCPRQVIGSLAGRLLSSYPHSISANILQQLILEYGIGVDDSSKATQGQEKECESMLTQGFSDTGSLVKVDTAEFASLLLQTCIMSAPLNVLDHWLHFQSIAESENRCAQELIAFKALEDMFYEHGNTWSVQTADQTPSETVIWLSSLLPNVLNAHSAIWGLNSYMHQLVDVNSPAVGSALRERLAQVLNNHAVCLLRMAETKAAMSPSPTSSPRSKIAVTLLSPEQATIRSGIEAMVSAYDIEPGPNRLMNLGLYMQKENSNAGYLVAARAAVQSHDARRDKYMRSPRPALTPWLGKGSSIAIYCYEYGNAYWGRWGPSSIEDGGGGLGGSEEAVLYLSEELARRGHRVTVYADPSDKDLRRGLIRGVRWRRHTEYSTAPGWIGVPDLFISWRYGLSLDIGANARKRLLWLQDLVDAKCFPPPRTSLGPQSVLVLSAFHRDTIIRNLLSLGYSNEEAIVVPTIVPNGIPMRFNPESQGLNDRKIFAYGSNPVRGLEQVLRVWPLIRSAIPDAELRVYYGFPTHVTEQLTKSMGESAFLQWREMLEELMQQPGVTYIGSVGHAELARAYAAAGFLLYPTNFPETGCITVQKAMAAGAIPITSRYIESVLPVLAGAWDMGPQVALTAAANYMEWLRDQWVPAVIEAAKTPEDKLQTHRDHMREAIRSQYGWESSADLLVQLLPEEEPR